VSFVIGVPPAASLLPKLSEKTQPAAPCDEIDCAGTHARVDFRRASLRASERSTGREADILGSGERQRVTG